LISIENKPIAQPVIKTKPIQKQQGTPVIKLNEKFLHNKMPTPPSKILSKPTTSQHKKSSSRISMKNVNGSVELKSTLDSKRNNATKVISMSERLNSIDKKNQFSNSKSIKSLNRANNNSFYDIKPKELSIDFNKSKNIVSPVSQTKNNLKNIVKNNLASSSFIKSLHDKENIMSHANHAESPMQKNLNSISVQSKDPYSNYKYSQKKSSSFISQFFDGPSQFKFGLDLSSHPRTENPSFVENDLNKSTCNFNCARVLRTTNDTDKENDPVYKIKQTVSPVSTSNPQRKNKGSISIAVKPKKQIESPFCHLKMPKTQNFFDSKKKLNSTAQRFATQY